MVALGRRSTTRACRHRRADRSMARGQSDGAVPGALVIWIVGCVFTGGVQNALDKFEFHRAAGTHVRLHTGRRVSKAARVSASALASDTRRLDRRVLRLSVISTQLRALRRRSTAVCLRAYEASDADDARRN